MLASLAIFFSLVNAPLSVVIVIVAYLHFLVSFSHFSYNDYVLTGKVLHLLFGSFALFTLSFLFHTQYQSVLSLLIVVFSFFLIWRYYRLFLLSFEIGSVWKGLLLTSSRVPVILAVTLYLMSEHLSYPALSEIWFIGLISPFILPLITIIISKTSLRDIFNSEGLLVRIESLSLLSIGASTIHTIKQLGFKYTDSLLIKLKNTIDNTISKAKRSKYSGSLFELESPEHISSEGMKNILKHSILYIIAAGVVTGVFEAFTSNPPSDSVLATLVVIPVAAVYTNIITSLLPKNEKPSTLLTKFLIPTYMIVPIYLYPDTVAGQLALYPLGLLILLYIGYKSGLLYGLLIPTIALLVMATTIAGYEFVRRAYLLGQISDGVAVAMISSAAILSILTIILLIYSTQRIAKHTLYETYYGVIGGMLISLMYASFIFGQGLYQIGLSETSVTYYFYLARVVGNIGWLLVGYMLYRLVLRLEEKLIDFRKPELV